MPGRHPRLGFSLHPTLRDEYTENHRVLLQTAKNEKKINFLGPKPSDNFAAAMRAAVLPAIVPILNGSRAARTHFAWLRFACRLQHPAPMRQPGMRSILHNKTSSSQLHPVHALPPRLHSTRAPRQLALVLHLQ